MNINKTNKENKMNNAIKGTITAQQLNALRKSYATTGDRVSVEVANELNKFLDKFGEGELVQLAGANIKWISETAVTKLMFNFNYKADDINKIMGTA